MQTPFTCGWGHGHWHGSQLWGQGGGEGKVLQVVVVFSASWQSGDTQPPLPVDAKYSPHLTVRWEAGHMGKAKENIQMRLNKHSCDRRDGKGLGGWVGPQLFYVLVVDFPLWALLGSYVK